MAETGRLSEPATPFASPVTLVRVAIVVGILAIWEAVAASGLLFRDVVPSLLVIGRATIELLADPATYFNLGVTAGEIGLAMLIGGLAGLAVGILLGANRLLSRAFGSYLYYPGPPPTLIFFPTIIMCFRLGPASNIAMGVLS